MYRGPCWQKKRAVIEQQTSEKCDDKSEEMSVMDVGEMDLVIQRGQVVTSSGVKKLAIGIKDGRIVALTSATESLQARQIPVRWDEAEF